VTTRTRIRQHDLARLAQADALGALVADQLERHMRRSGHDWAVPHDALAVATFAQPAFVRTRPMHIQVETHGQFTRAETVAVLADQTSGAPASPNVAVPPIDVALEVDVAGFESWLVETLATSPSRR
jgi:non-specific riboncleoside hydrolase